MANFSIEIAYQRSALVVQTLEVAVGTTVAEALNLACIEPVEDLCSRIGVYGRAIGLDYVLKPFDRIEIYADLIYDPKEARRLRAKRQRSIRTTRLPLNQTEN